jgi:hypothetical protein
MCRFLRPKPSILLGCVVVFAASFAYGQCPCDCKTTFCLNETPLSPCRMWSSQTTGLQVMQAWGAGQDGKAKTCAQVITETQPVKNTGEGLDMWNPPCDLTCPSTQNPQECTGKFEKKNSKGSVSQAKCKLAGG